MRKARVMFVVAASSSLFLLKTSQCEKNLEVSTCKDQSCPILAYATQVITYRFNLLFNLSKIGYQIGYILTYLR